MFKVMHPVSSPTITMANVAVSEVTDFCHVHTEDLRRC